MLKGLLFVVLGLAGLLALAAVAGMFVPRGHVASVTSTLNAPPDTVWSVITDFGAVPSWYPGVKAATPAPDVNGHAAWSEDFGGFKVTMETAEAVAPQKLVRVVHAGAGFRGSWTWELSPEGTGTRLVITERGEVDNPVFRLMGKLMDQTKTAREYAEALERRLQASRNR